MCQTGNVALNLIRDEYDVHVCLIHEICHVDIHTWGCLREVGNCILPTVLGLTLCTYNATVAL